MRLINNKTRKRHENYSTMLHRKIQYGSRKHEYAIEICGRFTKAYRNVTRHHNYSQAVSTVRYDTISNIPQHSDF